MYYGNLYLLKTDWFPAVRKLTRLLKTLISSETLRGNITSQNILQERTTFINDSKNVVSMFQDVNFCYQVKSQKKSYDFQSGQTLAIGPQPQ